MNKIYKYYFHYLDIKLQTCRAIAFWLLGWKNIKSLHVAYFDNQNTYTIEDLAEDGRIHKTISLTT